MANDKINFSDIPEREFQKADAVTIIFGRSNFKFKVVGPWIEKRK